MSTSYDLSEIRRRNDKAIKEILKKNEKLEELRGVQEHRLKLERAEKELYEECQKRLGLLVSEEEHVKNEGDRAAACTAHIDELYQQLEATNLQLVEDPLMRYYCTSVTEEQALFKKLENRLKEHVLHLNLKLGRQTEQLWKCRKGKKNLAEIEKRQNYYLNELKQKLKLNNLALMRNFRDKEQDLEHVIQRTDELLEKFQDLKEQLVDAPMMRFRNHRINMEKTRLMRLNNELEKGIANMEDKIKYQAYYESKNRAALGQIRKLLEVKDVYRKRIDELKEKVNLRTISRYSVNENVRNIKKLDKRLNRIFSNIDVVKSDLEKLQLAFVKYLGGKKPIIIENLETKTTPTDLKFGRKRSSTNAPSSEWERLSASQDKEEQKEGSKSEDETGVEELKESKSGNRTSEDDFPYSPAQSERSDDSLDSSAQSERSDDSLDSSAQSERSDDSLRSSAQSERSDDSLRSSARNERSDDSPYLSAKSEMSDNSPDLCAQSEKSDHSPDLCAQSEKSDHSPDSFHPCVSQKDFHMANSPSSQTQPSLTQHSGVIWGLTYRSRGIWRNPWLRWLGLDKLYG